MKNFDKKLLFLILGTIITWLIVGFLTYRLLISDILNLSQSIGNQKISFAQLDYNSQHYQIFQEDYEKVFPDLKKIENVVLSDQEFILFVQSLEKIAKENNLAQKINLEQVNASKSSSLNNEDLSTNKAKAVKKPTKPYSPLVFNIELKGNFPNLVKYVASLENLSSFPNLKYLTVNLKRSEKEGDPKDQIQAMLQVEVYLEKAEAK